MKLCTYAVCIALTLNSLSGCSPLQRWAVENQRGPKASDPSWLNGDADPLCLSACRERGLCFKDPNTHTCTARRAIDCKASRGCFEHNRCTFDAELNLCTLTRSPNASAPPQRTHTTPAPSAPTRPSSPPSPAAPRSFASLAAHPACATSCASLGRCARPEGTQTCIARSADDCIASTRCDTKGYCLFNPTLYRCEHPEGHRTAARAQRDARTERREAKHTSAARAPAKRPPSPSAAEPRVVVSPRSAQTKRAQAAERQAIAKRQAAERKRQAAERQRQAAAERKRRAAERKRQAAAKRQRQAAERKRLADARRAKRAARHAATIKRPTHTQTPPRGDDSDLAPPAANTRALGSGPRVFDFCAIADASDDTHTYRKQKLLMFSPSGLDKLEAGETVVNESGDATGTKRVLKAIDARAHFRDVWTQTFPLRRFFNVISPDPAPASVRDAESVSVDRVRAALTGPSSRFLQASARCADYLAVPHLDAFSARWSKRTKQVTRYRDGKPVKVTVTSWSLTAKPTVTLHIFRREGRTYNRVATVTERGGGLFDAVTDLGNLTQLVASPGNPAAAAAARDLTARHAAHMERIGDAITQTRAALRDRSGALNDLDAPNDDTLTQLEAQLRDLLAQRAIVEALLERPAETADALATAQNGGWDGLVSGLPADPSQRPPKATHSTRSDSAAPRAEVAPPPPTRAPFWLKRRSVGVAGMSERNRPGCKDLSGDALEAIARCTLRVRAENISLLVQEASQGVDGWRLFAPLLAMVRPPEDDASPEDAPSDATVHHGVSVGRREGVARGDVFFALCDTPEGPERCGFARVTHPGPGGDQGRAQPSEMTFRSGSPSPGVRMEEHPQIGVHFTPQFTMRLDLDALAFDVTGDGRTNISAPDTMSGFELAAAFALTPYVDYRHGELLLRTELGAGFAQTRSIPFGAFNWTLVHALAGPELSLYAIRNLNLFAAALGGVSFASVSNPDNTIVVDGEEQADSGSGISYGTLKVAAGADLILHPDWRIRASVGYLRNLTSITLQPAEIDEGTNPSRFFGQDIGTMSSVTTQLGIGYVF